MRTDKSRLISRRILLFCASALTALTVWALFAGSSIPELLIHYEGDSDTGDLALYERIAQRVAAGENYYDVSVDEQFHGNYPTSPPTAIRTPTMTYALVTFGSLASTVLRALIVMTLVVAMFRFEKFAPSRYEWYLSTLLLGAAVGLFAHPSAVFLPEAWAVLLMLLSALLHRPGRYWPSLFLGFSAVCFRELAGPFLIIMGLLAWRRDRRESLTWFGAALCFLMVYSAHWALASDAAQSFPDRVSPGWLEVGGWPYVIDTFKFSSIARTAPFWISAVAVGTAIFGWLVIRSSYQQKSLAVAFGFMGIFLFAGRPDTAYWGHLYVAFLLPGLAFAPRAFAQLLIPERRESSRRDSMELEVPGSSE